jgi:hypothetical protein
MGELGHNWITPDSMHGVQARRDKGSILYSVERMSTLVAEEEIVLGHTRKLLPPVT